MTLSNFNGTLTKLSKHLGYLHFIINFLKYLDKFVYMFSPLLSSTSEYDFKELLLLVIEFFIIIS